MINPKEFLDSYQLTRIQMMLCPTGFLTHCSYYKFKIIFLFRQLYNHPYSELSSQFPVNYAICISIKLHYMPFSPYSTVYRFIQSTSKSKTKLKQKHNSYIMNTQFANQKEIYSNIKTFRSFTICFLYN